MRVYNTTQTLPICLSRVNNLTSPPDFLLNRQTSFFTSSHFPPIQTNKPITCLLTSEHILQFHFILITYPSPRGTLSPQQHLPFYKSSCIHTRNGAPILIITIPNARPIFCTQNVNHHLYLFLHNI